MFREIVQLLCFLFLTAGFQPIAHAQSRKLAPSDDTQVWNEAQVSLPLHKRADLVLGGSFRIGHGVTNLVDERLGVAILIKAGKYVTLSPGYLHATTQPINNQSSQENRLVFFGTLRLPIGKLIATDRNQFERRVREPADSTRYRNRLQIEYPINLGTEFLMFLSDEVYYDWSQNKWVRNRLSVGCGKMIGKQIRLDLYYMRQNDGLSRPGDIHVVGSALKIDLR